MAPKPQVVPPSGSSEPSEPSEIRPEDKPKKQLKGEQEENPQVVAHRPGGQAADKKGDSKSGGSGSLDKVADQGFAGEKVKPKL
ncbi:uncharacterized protein PHACADRAFT_252691 [Phanerochaete carnosa HHB-10118-sp]|uniref:Uncharacterized protein n=1 Tax=Phanerochaete carnosa (strain HHB-10118-sp) TaxID=650164 RepID=K5X6C9_PHACS|nr:uncharacterized protein PHACADRAFT_252691 [Phanerochaete carnosa HHB-10118-sp]EKM58402.1 hypothetical protein PHACADRAFT_252691 [Phanerochaete carnosa HHB-10118-sp]